MCDREIHAGASNARLFLTSMMIRLAALQSMIPSERLPRACGIDEKA
jgi:hypothetical protein